MNVWFEGQFGSEGNLLLSTLTLWALLPDNPKKQYIASFILLREKIFLNATLITRNMTKMHNSYKLVYELGLIDLKTCRMFRRRSQLGELHHCPNSGHLCYTCKERRPA